MVEVAPLETADEQQFGFFGGLTAEFSGLRRGFANWPELSARITVGRLLGHPPGLALRTRLGPVLHTPTGDRSWRTAVEVFGNDCYRLGNMALPSAPVFVDVGANIGAFALGMLARWPSAQGECYEPSPLAYAALAINLGNNGIAEQVRSHGTAVTGTIGTTTVQLFERLSDSCTSTLLPQAADDDAARPGRWVEVPALSLNEVLSQRPGGVDVLKIDVEGAEYEIIESVSVDALVPVKNVIVEYHSIAGRTVGELADRFNEAGFIWRRQERSALPGQGLCWWERPRSIDPR